MERTFTIVFSDNLSIETINWISSLLKELGLTQETIKSWAITRMLICIGIGIGMIIFICFMTPAREQPTKKTKDTS